MDMKREDSENIRELSRTRTLVHLLRLPWQDASIAQDVLDSQNKLLESSLLDKLEEERSMRSQHTLNPWSPMSFQETLLIFAQSVLLTTYHTLSKPDLGSLSQTIVLISWIPLVPTSIFTLEDLISWEFSQELTRRSMKSGSVIKLDMLLMVLKSKDLQFHCPERMTDLSLNWLGKKPWNWHLTSFNLFLEIKFKVRLDNSLILKQFKLSKTYSID